MADLDSVVSLSIIANTATRSDVGYGIPLLLSASASWGDVVREYTSLPALGADFVAGTAEYGMASAIFSQSPRPEKVVVGKLAHKPTMVWAITPIAINAKTYQMKVDGNLVSYTADSSATLTEIHLGLKTAIDALSLGLTVADATTYMSITSTVAGAWHRIESLDPANLAVSQTMTDSSGTNIKSDLDAIQVVNDTWYTILNPYSSKDITLGIADWAESHSKTFIPTIQESLSATLAASTNGTGDIMQSLETGGYKRTMPFYHPDNGSFLGEAVAGARLPTKPGSETWKFINLAGVATVNLTDTQKANILNKHGNFYALLDGQGRTSEGWTSGGEYFDTERGIDWQALRIKQNVVGVLVGSGGKVPFTDPGIALVEGAVRAALMEGVAVGFINPGFSVTFPRAASISSTDRANRLLPSGEFSATIQGAIHKVTINGTISA